MKTRSRNKTLRYRSKRHKTKHSKRSKRSKRLKKKSRFRRKYTGGSDWSQVYMDTGEELLVPGPSPSNLTDETSEMYIRRKIKEKRNGLTEIEIKDMFLASKYYS